MMNNKVLSIIIPTYNMERYLGACLDSLLITGLQRIEVIIVNDGSIDSSHSIAASYEERYPNVFRVIDKENGNYGSCINRGLKEAVGKYVKVLDADDSFDTANFCEFVDFLDSVDADLILSDYVEVDEQGSVTGKHDYDFPEDVELKFKDICSTDTFKNMQMHAVTYRRQMLVDMGYVQSEGVSYTDQQWIFIPMVRVRSVRRFGKCVYRYLLGRVGQTMDPAIKRKHMNHIMVCVHGMLVAYNHFLGEIDETIREYLMARLLPFSKEVYVTLLTNYNDETKAALIGFDKDIKSLNNEFYELIGSKDVSSFLGFKYIDYWRRKYNKMNNTVVRMFSTMYMLLVQLKNKLGR